MNELIAKLVKLGERECWSDEKWFSANECSGGNPDDAYYGGCRDGETLLAREVLAVLRPEGEGAVRGETEVPHA